MISSHPSLDDICKDARFHVRAHSQLPGPEQGRSFGRAPFYPLRHGRKGGERGSGESRDRLCMAIPQNTETVGREAWTRRPVPGSLHRAFWLLSYQPIICQDPWCFYFPARRMYDFFFFPPLDEVKYFLKVSRAGGTRRPRSGRARSVEGAMWTRSWSPAAPDLVEGSKPGPGRRREDRPQPVGRDSRMRPPGTRHVTVVLNKLRFFFFFFSVASLTRDTHFERLVIHFA